MYRFIIKIYFGHQIWFACKHIIPTQLIFVELLQRNSNFKSQNALSWHLHIDLAIFFLGKEFFLIIHSQHWPVHQHFVLTFCFCDHCSLSRFLGLKNVCMYVQGGGVGSLGFAVFEHLPKIDHLPKFGLSHFCIVLFQISIHYNKMFLKLNLGGLLRGEILVLIIFKLNYKCYYTGFFYKYDNSLNPYKFCILSHWNKSSQKQHTALNFNSINSVRNWWEWNDWIVFLKIGFRVLRLILTFINVILSKQLFHFPFWS